MLQQFILDLLIKAAQDPEIQKFVDDRIDRLKKSLLPDIVATFPTFVASAMKVFSIKMPNMAEIPDAIGDLAQDTAQHILDSDPDLPGISDFIDLSELAKKWLGR